MPRHRRATTHRLFIDFQYLKEHASFEDVLTHYGCARPNQRDQFLIRCPLPGHDDRDPSCSIDLSKRQFHCFGCDRGGSILDFVAYREGLDPDRDDDLRSAARTLADVCSLPLSERARGPKSREKASRAPEVRVNPPSRPKAPPGALQEELRASLGSSLAAWHEPRLERLEPRPAPLKFVTYDHPYLAQRGLEPALAERLGIGFYEGTGLMRGRVVVAIHDWWQDDTSNLVAYLGRWPGDEVPEGTLRWKFPEGFKKTQVLYNLHRIARTTRHAFVVEGAFDCVRLCSLDYPAVAVLGRSIAPEQIKLLKQAGIRFATVLLDGNDAGRDAAPRVAAALAHGGLYARIVYLPDGTDPASVDQATLESLLTRSRTSL